MLTATSARPWLLGVTRTVGHEQTAAYSELQDLIATAARLILMHEDPAVFLRWMRDYGPEIAQQFFAVAPDELTRHALAYALGRAIWNATPLPSNRFRPRALPAPGRNDPCPCGSGDKYKHCCGAPALPELPVSREMMLAEVLDLWPASRFRELPYEHLSPEVLGGVAADWLEEGSPERAMKLLEPLFAEVERLDQRAEHAFDVLADAYMQLHRPKKKAALVERLARARSAELRAAACSGSARCLPIRGASRTPGAYFARANAPARIIPLSDTWK